MKSKKKFLKPNSLFIIVFLFCFFLAATVHAQDQRWWQKHEEGWYFYHEEPMPEEPEIKEEKQLPPMASGAAPSSPAPEPLFTAEMKRKGEELLSAAMQKPSIENVK